MDDVYLSLFTGTRFLHVLSAVLLMGGAAFLRFVLIPAIEKSLTDEQHAALRAEVLPRWKRLVHLAIGVLLVSGAVNYARMIVLIRSEGGKDPIYHAVIGIKIILAMAVFTIASGLVGKSKAFAGLRANPKKWLLISLLLATVILGMSAYLRVRQRPSKALSPVATAASTAQ